MDRAGDAHPTAVSLLHALTCCGVVYSRPTPRRQHQDLLRKQKLAILCEALCEHSTPGLGELFCVYLQSLVPEEARKESTWLL